MINLNLHGRHPKDLPDKLTINDILLELQDTNKFDISWINLYNKSDWRANNQTFNEWIVRGQVVTCEMNNSSALSLISEPTSGVAVTETRYDIVRHPIRISVKLKPDIFSLKLIDEQIIDTLIDVYLRLKDYLGPDVIQDQYGSGFDIDFMISGVKVIV